MNRRHIHILCLTLVAATGAGLVTGATMRSRSLVASDVAVNPYADVSQLRTSLEGTVAVLEIGFVLFVLGITGFGLLALHAWKRRRTRTDACRQCGYARSGWASDRCPECGAVGDVSGGVASKA